MEVKKVTYEEALARFKRSLEIKRNAEKRMAEEWARRGITGTIVSLWNRFKKHAVPERFTIRTASAIVEGKGFYAAIIVENRNPLLETIIADFESTAQALTEGKP